MANEDTNSSQNKEHLFTQSLQISSDEQIISLIEELRANGEAFIVKPLLMELFNKQRGEKLKEEIVEFLIDIKDQNVVPAVVEIIRTHINETEIPMLVSACWQSRLNFSNELDLFIDILINGSYVASIEAFSVIENSLDFFDNQKREDIKESIVLKMKKVSSEKLKLIEETIKMIDDFVIE